jgi:hypothetical protein
VVRVVISAATATATFLGLNVLGEQPIAGLLGFDLNPHALVKATESSRDALEDGVRVDLDADLVSILGTDLKGLCADVLRQDRPIEMPKGRLRGSCEGVG